MSTFSTILVHHYHRHLLLILFLFSRIKLTELFVFGTEQFGTLLFADCVVTRLSTVTTVLPFLLA